MNRLRNFLRQQEFHVLLFFAGFVLFNWPFLSLFDAESLKEVFIYFFMAWAAVIFILFLIGRGRSGSDSQF